MKVRFTKMQGLGNDFAVINATKDPFQLTTSQIQKMANRRFGVGFDQLLVLESSGRNGVDFNFRIFNADGSEVGQCGNGARCIARFIQEQNLSKASEFAISTLSDILHLKLENDDKVSVHMGVPHFNPVDVPFVADKAANLYDVEVNNQLVKLGVVNIGNPHAIIPVDQIDAGLVSTLGAQLSTHDRFPEGTNVGFMQVINPQNIRLRVYERGTGETLACGSGACAAVAVGRRNGLLQERVMVSQPGGSLSIHWQGPDTPILMTGPATTVFQGEWED
ncbi:diaminopimelate epimerase [Candidiatus Paracoxiella cheracis]|uniref:diaminopimelate epimerase n=1 Tax=Candidiatus Paracoxiella cheracis TaxID=3405120 RepID=UPI003BF5B628